MDRETHRKHSKVREEKARTSKYERSGVITQLGYSGAFWCGKYFKVITPI
jgi:hypothetical protein